jgi:ATP-dependent Clp protease protease subunit
MKEEIKISLLFNNNLDVDNRTVYLFDDINEKSALNIIKNLSFLDKTEGDIKIVINSIGGNTNDGWAIIDCISKLKNNTYGYVPGQASSMAVDILICCTTRGMSKNASLMVHAGSINVEGETKAAINQVKFEEEDQERSIDLWSKKLKINKKRIKELLATDTFLNSKEALRYGFVDEVT